MQKSVKRAISVIVPLLSILLALLIGAVIMVCLGANPGTAFQSLWTGAFGSKANVGTTLTKATPLIFTGLCACFAYRCGVFNLGGEGQFIMGAIAACTVCLLSGLTGLPAILLALAAGAAAGGLWGFLPGILKISRGQNEMIISIMFNYIATLLMGVVYTNWLREGSVPQTASVPKESMLPRVVPDMRVTWGFVIAVALGFIIYYFLQKTGSGFKGRAVGCNATAAHFCGIPVKKYMLATFIISGAIAGLGGSAELLGTQYRLINGFAAGYGFDGVAIALIAQLNPIATIVVAIFFAALRAGSTTMQAATGVPTSVSDIIQALVIVFTVAGMALTQLSSFEAFFLKRAHRTGGEVTA